MTDRWKHQEEDLEASWQLPEAMIDWEPRLGKSRLVIETAERLFDAGKIDAAAVVAPNGVHLGWSRDQLPKYWNAPAAVLEWDSAKAAAALTAKADGRLTEYGRRLESLADTPGFVWVLSNLEALRTSKKARELGNLERFLRGFLRRRRALLVVDESHGIKDPRSLQTKAADRLAQLADYRRTLTGTPMADSPFDLWAQYHFLNPAILGPVFTAFRSRYGLFKRGGRPVRCPACDWPPGEQGHPIVNWRLKLLECRNCEHRWVAGGPVYTEVAGYQRLEELRKRIAPVTFSRKKAECLDLPARVFAVRHFIMPPAHRRAYDSLREDLLARLDSGEEMTVTSALAKLLRLQQISRGTFKPDDGHEREIGGPAPSVEAVLELVRENRGKTIVWCRFRADVERLAAAFDETGVTYIRCDGDTPMDARPGLRDLFNDPESSPQVWLGTLGTGGVGVDLGGASLMVFYSHGFKLVERIQGLERNYGSSQKADRIDVVDLVAADSVDLRALEALARKEDLAAQITGRRLRELLA